MPHFVRLHLHHRIPFCIAKPNTPHSTWKRRNDARPKRAPTRVGVDLCYTIHSTNASTPRTTPIAPKQPARGAPISLIHPPAVPEKCGPRQRPLRTTWPSSLPYLPAQTLAATRAQTKIASTRQALVQQHLTTHNSSILTPPLHPQVSARASRASSRGWRPRRVPSFPAEGSRSPACGPASQA